MNADTLITNIKNYFNLQLDSMGTSNPMIKLVKPFISKYMDLNINKAEKFLKAFTDKDGEINIEDMVNDFIVNLKTMDKPSIIDSKVMGDIEFSNKGIKATIPYLDKQILLSIDDLEFMKEFVTKN